MDRVVPGTRLVAQAIRLGATIAGEPRGARRRWRRCSASRRSTMRSRWSQSPGAEGRSASDTIPEVLNMRRPSSPYGSSSLLRPRPDLDGAQGAHRRERRDVRRHRADAGPDATTSAWCPTLVLHQFWVWQLVTYMFLHGGHLPHPVQHAGAVDVRRRAGADLGHALLPEVLFRHRHRRRRADGAVLAAAVRVRAAAAALGDHRRVRRDLRPAAGVRDVLPGSPDPADRLLGAGEVVRRDSGRDCVVLVALRRGRHRQRDAPRRTAGRLSLPEGRAASTRSPR